MTVLVNAPTVETTTPPAGDPEPLPSTPEEILLRGFLAARRHRGPVLVLSERITIANASASETLQASDRVELWRLTRKHDLSKQTGGIRLKLSNGASALALWRALSWNGNQIGVLLRLSITSARRRITSAKAVPDGATCPWDELTDTERAIVEIVAEGCTNREVGKRLYSSPHTVDSHLRHIFQKLGISSRVELARLLGERRKFALASVDA